MNITCCDCIKNIFDLFITTNVFLQMFHVDSILLVQSFVSFRLRTPCIKRKFRSIIMYFNPLTSTKETLADFDLVILYVHFQQQQKTYVRGKTKDNFGKIRWKIIIFEIRLPNRSKKLSMINLKMLQLSAKQAFET